MTQYLKSNGHSYVIVLEGSYQGSGIFSPYYMIIDHKGTLQEFSGSIKIDVVFNKGNFPEFVDSPLLINSHSFMEIAGDKALQDGLFRGHMPDSYMASSEAEVLRYIDGRSGQMMVLKPTGLNGGRGVQVVRSTQDIDRSNYFEAPFVVQDFIDSSGGISDLVDGVHDLRVYMLNSEPVCMSIRQPAPESLIANTHRGGTINFYGIDRMPSGVAGLVPDVDSKLSQFGPRYYSIDVMLGKDRVWRLIEINEKPAIPSSDKTDPFVDSIVERVCDFFIENAMMQKD